MFDLNNKVALITASAQGIGKASALALAQQGAEVWATDINEESLSSLKAEAESKNLNVKTFVLDVTNKEEINSLIKQMGEVDILFNCAGFVADGSILDATEEQLDFSISLNVKSMFYLIKAVLPKMIKNKKGSIINMSSAASSIKGVSNRFIYGASKAAVVGLTKSVAADFIKDGVRCNAICPGTIQSPSLDERINAQAEKLASDQDSVRDSFIARQPLGRLGTPEEVAALVVYLASDESAFVTGTNQIIDGGWSN